MGRKYYFLNLITVVIGLIIFTNCTNSDNEKAREIPIQNHTATTNVTIEEPEKIESINLLDEAYKKVKLSKAINTKQNEYHPVPNQDGSIIYFVGMDRTGQFSTKIDFTKSRNYGGEDIWESKRVNGIYTDAKALTEINNNDHQSVTGIFKNRLIVYGIYEEAFKVDGSGNGSGMYNGDLFLVSIDNGSLEHLGEPVNTIFFESDGFISSDGKVLLFVTDKNPLDGSYHQKGWLYENTFWGNTDIWMSEKVDDYWTTPVNLGSIINTPYAERTPYLSRDMKKLYFSSSGHPGYGDQDVFVSERTNTNSWTEWSVPKNLGSDINGRYNDWGFKLYNDESMAVMASETKLPYKKESTLSGNGGVREHNLRNGYKVEGKQSASFNYDCRSDIFYVDMLNADPVITIEDMLFDFNKSTIKSSQINLIERLTELINDNKNYKISIIGHTDNVGAKDYNIELSQKRAKAIYQALLDKGIDPSVLEYEGRWYQEPIVDNDSEINRKKNRRVEIVFK